MRREALFLLAVFGISLFVGATARGQRAEIDGWDRVRFGMTPAQVRALYPGGRLDEERDTLFIPNPAEATVMAICQFNEAHRCTAVQVILAATDQLGILRGLERRYGAPCNHDQRFGSEWYYFGNRREAMISMFLITREWLAEGHRLGTRLAQYEGHVAVFYMDRPGSAPEPTWRPRPPL